MSQKKRPMIPSRQEPPAPATAPGLSLVMIVKDEEAHLERALASAAPLVDEIIVVDTGSTDRSPEIAESFGAKVFRHPWENDFAKHRNQALDHASGQWCLQLDADEELDRSTCGELKRLLAAPRAAAFLVEIRNLTPAGGYTSFSWPRLFARRPGTRYWRRVHNQLKVDGPVARSPLRIIHHGYAGDPEHLRARQERRVAMVQRWVQDEPGNWEAHRYLAQTLVAEPEQRRKAVAHARRALDLAREQGVGREGLSGAFLPLLQGLGAMERFAEMEGPARAWAELLPGHPDPWLFLCRCSFFRGRYQQALEAARRFIRLQERVAHNPGALAGVENSTAPLLDSVLVIWLASARKLEREPEAEAARSLISARPDCRRLLETADGLVSESEPREPLKPGPRPQKGGARILSVYCGHDANLCLLEDGEPVLVTEKERFTRVKHDSGSLEGLVAKVLADQGWDPRSIDLVVINPFVHPSGPGQGAPWELTGKPFTGHPDYLRPDWRGEAEARTSRHRIHMLGRRMDCLAVDHHLAHAALALFTSPFEQAAVLSADGGGDERYLALAWGSGSRIEWIEYDWGRQKQRDHSELNIGSTWASIGQHNFGYRRLEGAGKLMGLASYAEPDPDLMDHLLRHMSFYWPYPFPTGLFRQPVRLGPRDPFAQALAATLQHVTTGLLLGAAERAREMTGAKHVCLTGGCAMNCLANSAVHHSGLFEDSFVPAQPHDGGLALGQALFAWHHLWGNRRRPRAWSPYLGTDTGPAPEGCQDEIVSALVEGLTVGVCFGRAESGPRALGHRSILADPRNGSVRELLNNRVKNREWFRPFAPVVLSEHYDNWFSQRVPSRYMSYTAMVRESRRQEIPGVVHVDGSARPQLLERGHDPFLHSVLEEFHRRSGVPILLNTSFNCQEPLVDSAEQARRTWKGSGLDVLVTSEGVQRKAPGLGRTATG